MTKDWFVRLPLGEWGKKWLSSMDILFERLPCTGQSTQLLSLLGERAGAAWEVGSPELSCSFLETTQSECQIGEFIWLPSKRNGTQDRFNVGWVLYESKNCLWCLEISLQGYHWHQTINPTFTTFKQGGKCYQRGKWSPEHKPLIIKDHFA